MAVEGLADSIVRASLASGQPGLQATKAQDPFKLGQAGGFAGAQIGKKVERDIKNRKATTAHIRLAMQANTVVPGRVDQLNALAFKIKNLRDTPIKENRELTAEENIKLKKFEAQFEDRSPGTEFLSKMIQRGEILAETKAERDAKLKRTQETVAGQEKVAGIRKEQGVEVAEKGLEGVKAGVESRKKLRIELQEMNDKLRIDLGNIRSNEKIKLGAQRIEMRKIDTTHAENLQLDKIMSGITSQVNLLDAKEAMNNAVIKGQNERNAARIEADKEIARLRGLGMNQSAATLKAKSDAIDNNIKLAKQQAESFAGKIGGKDRFLTSENSALIASTMLNAPFFLKRDTLIQNRYGSILINNIKNVHSEVALADGGEAIKSLANQYGNDFASIGPAGTAPGQVSATSKATIGLREMAEMNNVLSDPKKLIELFADRQAVLLTAKAFKGINKNWLGDPNAAFLTTKESFKKVIVDQYLADVEEGNDSGKAGTAHLEQFAGALKSKMKRIGAQVNKLAQAEVIDKSFTGLVGASFKNWVSQSKKEWKFFNAGVILNSFDKTPKQPAAKKLLLGVKEWEKDADEISNSIAQVSTELQKGIKGANIGGREKVELALLKLVQEGTLGPNLKSSETGYLNKAVFKMFPSLAEMVKTAGIK